MALFHELNSTSEPQAAGHLIPEAASRWVLLQVCWARGESCGKGKGTAYLAFGILLTEWRLMGEATPLGLRDIHLLLEADPQGKGRDQAT